MCFSVVLRNFANDCIIMFHFMCFFFFLSLYPHILHIKVIDTPCITRHYDPEQSEGETTSPIIKYPSLRAQRGSLPKQTTNCHCEANRPKQPTKQTPNYTSLRAQRGSLPKRWQVSLSPCQERLLRCTRNDGALLRASPHQAHPKAVIVCF